jgi:hypothetical protein
MGGDSGGLGLRILVAARCCDTRGEASGLIVGLSRSSDDDSDDSTSSSNVESGIPALFITTPPALDCFAFAS